MFFFLLSLDMEKMLTCYQMYKQRVRYIKYLFVREFDIWYHTINKAENKIKKEQMFAEEWKNDSRDVGCFDRITGQLQYGYWRNSMFGQKFNDSLRYYTLHKLRQAQMFGQKLVVDCSFDETMADYETISVSRQIYSIYHANRYSSDPFKLMFTGWHQNNRGYQYVVKNLKDIIDKPEYYFNYHTEDFHQLFGKSSERLIYLSPDSRKLMTTFDPNAVYIIGALVSKTHKSKYTFQKARALDIESYRLPIHEHVKLKPMVKRVLSFLSVFKILLHFKQHGDWEKAFRAEIFPHKLKERTNENHNEK